LALLCDYVVAVESSYFLFAFANIGLVCDTGVSYTLPKLVGRRKAFELVTLGERVYASEALQLRMVNEVVPTHEELDARVAAIAKRYAERPPIAMRIMKDMMHKADQGATFEEMLLAEEYGQEIAGRSNDFMEGVAAFLQKRKPEFKGR
jgi:2-(1,2-epoxy-1,2-dihydrophenyl)acetyl-CoA isomerase